MKIWEIDLSINGKKYNSKNNDYEVVEGNLYLVDKELEGSYNVLGSYDLVELLKLDFEEYITNQVTWQQAIEAWAHGCDVEWILNNVRCSYDGENEYFWDNNDAESLFKQQIVEGKWRIAKDYDMKKMEKIWEERL